tara:strand:+ start:9 stop:803 length:795 start_codon:yes stop_codon:yes gene_type:complete
MKSRVGYYFGIYRHFFATSLSEETSYRLNFVLLVLMNVFSYVVLLSSIEVLYAHVENIGPWDRSQFLLFAAFMITIDSIHMTFISENFWELSENLRLGNFDFTLLKPADSMFTSYFRRQRPSVMVSIFVAVGLLIYYGQQANLQWWAWLVMPILIVMGLALQVSLEIILSCAMFRTIESFGINFLRLQLQNMSRWPEFIYPGSLRRLMLYGVPVLLIGSGPTHFLIDPTQWHWLVIMLIALVVNIWIARHLWRWGLRHYDSASS